MVNANICCYQVKDVKVYDNKFSGDTDKKIHFGAKDNLTASFTITENILSVSCITATTSFTHEVSADTYITIDYEDCSAYTETKDFDYEYEAKDIKGSIALLNNWGGKLKYDTAKGSLTCQTNTNIESAQNGVFKIQQRWNDGFTNCTCGRQTQNKGTLTWDCYQDGTPNTAFHLDMVYERGTELDESGETIPKSTIVLIDPSALSQVKSMKINNQSVAKTSTYTFPEGSTATRLTVQYIFNSSDIVASSPMFDNTKDVANVKKVTVSSGVNSISGQMFRQGTKPQTDIKSYETWNDDCTSKIKHQANLSSNWLG